MLAIVGPIVSCAFVLFYPPTAQIGAIGWALFVPSSVLSIAFGFLTLTLRIRLSWTRLYAHSFAGIAQITLLQWLAGGGHAPYMEWLLLPCLGVATGHTVRRCMPVLVTAGAAAFSPLLYGSVELPATIAEVTLLSVTAIMVSAVMTSVRHHRADLRDAGEYAATLARIDTLTGLPNRRSFEETLAHTVESCRRDGRPLSLLLCDVDSFKDINDTFGHPVGDTCLKSIAMALRDALRRPDAAFRWAGDEFAVILHDTDELSATAAAARLQEAVQQCCKRPDGEAITIGVGLATLTDGGSAAQLLAEADVTMLEHKAARRRSELLA